MEICKLHEQLIRFALGMPALAISWRQIDRDVAETKRELQGVYPGNPSPFMANIAMPVYGLAYSAFINQLQIVQKTPGSIELSADMIATVHPFQKPNEIIRTYEIRLGPKTRIQLSYDGASQELHWTQAGSVQPNIVPSWGTDYVKVLATTNLPTPKDQSYLDEVERQILWLTAPSFVRLVTDALPRYHVPTLVPWLSLIAPTRVEYGLSHVLVTAHRATMTAGFCTPETVMIEPDPSFPYGETVPTVTKISRPDFAVYVPKGRLLKLASQGLMPAVMVSDSAGGIIKWAIAGSVGLERLVVDVLGAAGLTGVVRVGAGVKFAAAASAWIDGPSGVRLSLASASVLGDGDFLGDIQIVLDTKSWTVDVTLLVVQCAIPKVNFDLNTPLPWPLESIAKEIIEHITKQEARKLAGKVVHLGRWKVMGTPSRYPDSFDPDDSAITSHEGLANVSTMFTISRKSNEG